MPHVTFVSQGESATVRATVARPGRTLLEAAQDAGIEVVATCGGRGRCRSCRVKVLKGEVPTATEEDRTQLGEDEVREQFRLACQTKVIADCSVLVTPPTSEVGYQVFLNESGPARDGAARPESGVEKQFLIAESPEGIDEQISDAERLLGASGGVISRELRLDLLRKLPSAIRQRHGEVTLTTFNGTLVDVEPGDSRLHRYGMAFDIGTTTIVGTLLDLSTGDRLVSVAGVNPQATYGGDLMSRIAFVQMGDKNLAKLRTRILQQIDDFVREACRKTGVPPRQIYKIVIVGNPCMHHILLGIDVSYLGVAPYAAVVRDGILASARELPLKSAPCACVCLLPLIAGFVGSDTVGAVLAAGIEAERGTRLLVDIGTNTEVVMAAGGRLVASSAPAGPAFEGGQIRFGMRAALGAIEAVEIDDDVKYRTVGDAEAIGICGSGLIDAVAKMLDAGLIEPGGVLRQSNRDALPIKLRRRFRQTDFGDEFVLVDAGQSGRGEDITISQGDIRQLQLAKGAVSAAIQMLQQSMGASNDQIDELLLCGGFGNYINLRSAVRIGMLPDLGGGRIRYIGNAAHAGAELALLSEPIRARAEGVARRVAHISLAEQADFQDVFVRALEI